MPRHLLGKEVPRHTPAHPKRPQQSQLWKLLAAVPFVMSAFLILLSPPTQQNTLSQSGPREIRRLAATPSLDGCRSVVASLMDGDGTKLFPIIPKQLRDGNCVQTYWGKEVAFYFIVKALAILNYLAGAMAILLTVYAGILYLTGFASEANVKKAKTVLVGTYVGFFIILFARFIIIGSFQLFGDASDAKNADTLLDTKKLP